VTLTMIRLSGRVSGEFHTATDAAIIESQHGKAAAPERIGQVAQRQVAGQLGTGAVAILRP
jgi:hypothetical protein